MARESPRSDGQRRAIPRTAEAIVELWQRAGKRARLDCPTPRGAAVLTELKGLWARTVHRLSLQVAFPRDADGELDADAVVIDEASRLDATLTGGFLDAPPLRCTLLLVGDEDQLPSVGPGQLLLAIFNCAAVEHAQPRLVGRRFEVAGKILRSSITRRRRRRRLTMSSVILLHMMNIVIRSDRSSVPPYSEACDNSAVALFHAPAATCCSGPTNNPGICA